MDCSIVRELAEPPQAAHNPATSMQLNPTITAAYIEELGLDRNRS